ncbi:hypothetical protein ScPMuIL_018628 [Solemya velum]
MSMGAATDFNGTFGPDCQSSSDPVSLLALVRMIQERPSIKDQSPVVPDVSAHSASQISSFNTVKHKEKRGQENKITSHADICSSCCVCLTILIEVNALFHRYLFTMGCSTSRPVHVKMQPYRDQSGLDSGTTGDSRGTTEGRSYKPIKQHDRGVTQITYLSSTSLSVNSESQTNTKTNEPAAKTEHK